MDRYADGPAYLGPTTFCKVPLVSTEAELDAVKPDVAIVGAPWDEGVTYRPGARFGPRSVRIATYQAAEWHLELEVAPLEVLRVVDYGDALCLPGMAEASHTAIRTRVGEVAHRGHVARGDDGVAAAVEHRAGEGPAEPG